MQTAKKLTEDVVFSHIEEFIDRYNRGDYRTACDLYADEVLYYDGNTTSRKSREAVLADMLKAVGELVGEQPIIVTHRVIDVSIDSRSALVHMRFTIGNNKFAVQMTVEWISKQPQVTYDRTIAI